MAGPERGIIIFPPQTRGGNFYKHVEKIVKNNALTKELIGKLIDKIYVYKGRKVEIIYNFENEYESEAATNA